MQNAGELTGMKICGDQLALAVLEREVTADGARLEEGEAVVVDVGHLSEGLLLEERRGLVLSLADRTSMSVGVSAGVTG